MKTQTRKAQTVVETVIGVFVIVVALIVMSKYFSKYLAGKWQSTADSSYGKAFDPKETEFKQVYHKSGDTVNIIRMENRTNTWYKPEVLGDVWYQTSYQVAGPDALVNDIGQEVVAADANRKPLSETNSYSATTQWKELDD